MTNLYALAAQHNKLILENSSSGFGVPMILTNPDGVSQEITGMAADIGQALDPDTGLTVSGRLVSITLRSESILIGTPRAVPDIASRPWVVEFELPGGAPAQFKIMESQPDGLGSTNYFCEVYHGSDQ